ncbi:MAG TPA: hypothetical protein VGG51_12045 [Candidatus Cybelea sp.]|jgi:hypothetical protein
MPRLATTKPMQKQSAATNIAARGPARSTHLPNTADESPRKTIAMLKIQPIGGTDQSVAAGAVMPIACDIGLVKTLNAYTSPMQRWIQSAAGGTSQRLKPGFAIERERSKNAAMADGSFCGRGALQFLSRPNS